MFLHRFKHSVDIPVTLWAQSAVSRCLCGQSSQPKSRHLSVEVLKLPGMQCWTQPHHMLCAVWWLADSHLCFPRLYLWHSQTQRCPDELLLASDIATCLHHLRALAMGIGDLECRLKSRIYWSFCYTVFEISFYTSHFIQSDWLCICLYVFGFTCILHLNETAHRKCFVSKMI